MLRTIGKGLHEIARVIGEKNFVRELWLSGVDATTFNALGRFGDLERICA